MLSNNPRAAPDYAVASIRLRQFACLRPSVCARLPSCMRRARPRFVPSALRDPAQLMPLLTNVMAALDAPPSVARQSCLVVSLIITISVSVGIEQSKTGNHSSLRCPRDDLES